MRDERGPELPSVNGLQHPLNEVVGCCRNEDSLRRRLTETSNFRSLDRLGKLQSACRVQRGNKHSSGSLLLLHSQFLATIRRYTLDAPIDILAHTMTESIVLLPRVGHLQLHSAKKNLSPSTSTTGEPGRGTLPGTQEHQLQGARNKPAIGSATVAYPRAWSESQ